MNHAIKNQIFLELLVNKDPRTRSAIIDFVAKNNEVSKTSAFFSLIDPEAESLLDYLHGGLRQWCSILMKKYKLN